MNQAKTSLNEAQKTLQKIIKEIIANNGNQELEDAKFDEVEEEVDEQ